MSVISKHVSVVNNINYIYSMSYTNVLYDGQIFEGKKSDLNFKRQELILARYEPKSNSPKNVLV
jgi:hypothetical protein